MRIRLKLLLRLPGFLAWFAGQMVRANWQVATDLLTPGSALTPAIIAYRAQSATPTEVTALTNLISLTPGTLALDVDEAPGQGHTLYVLGLYASADPEEFRAELADLERRMLGVMRPADTADEEVHSR